MFNLLLSCRRVFAPQIFSLVLKLRFLKEHSPLCLPIQTLVIAVHANRPHVLVFILKNCCMHHFLSVITVFQGNSYQVVGVCFSKCAFSFCLTAWAVAEEEIGLRFSNCHGSFPEISGHHLVDRNINSVYRFCPRLK